MLKIDTKGRVELFRARTGSHNYNLNDENSDEDWKVFVLPTFEDLYSGHKHSQPNYVSDKVDYSIQDIRVLSEQIFKANSSFLEVLYSDVIIVNPKLDEYTKRLLNDIFNMRDRLTKANLWRMYNSSIGMYWKYLKKMKNTSTMSKESLERGYCAKSAMGAYRQLDFLCRFKATGDFGKALKYKEGSYKDILMSIKNGDYGNSEQVEKLLESSLNIVKTMCEESFKLSTIDEEVILEVENITKEIVSINYSLGVIK